MRAIVVAMLTGALLVPAWVLAPTASAHCDKPPVLGPVTQCPVHDQVEAAIVELNEAAGGEFAFVMARDRLFHPEIVTIRDGGTIIWIWGDAQNTGDDHDPRSTGRCVGAGANPELDPVSCRPSALAGDPVGPGKCFDIFVDEEQKTLGKDKEKKQFYMVALQYDAPRQLVQKNHRAQDEGYDLQGSPAFDDCPVGTEFSASQGQVVVPYHCGIHGFVAPTQMRGTIMIEGA